MKYFACTIMPNIYSNDDRTSWFRGLPSRIFSMTASYHHVALLFLSEKSGHFPAVSMRTKGVVHNRLLSLIRIHVSNWAHDRANYSAKQNAKVQIENNKTEENG
jgi:hypothetical protein